MHAVIRQWRLALAAKILAVHDVASTPLSKVIGQLLHPPARARRRSMSKNAALHSRASARLARTEGNTVKRKLT